MKTNFATLDENLKKESKIIKDTANLDLNNDLANPEVYDKSGQTLVKKSAKILGSIDVVTDMLS